MSIHNDDCFYACEEFQDYFKTSARSTIIKTNAPAYTIVAVSDRYLDLTHRKREDLLNQDFFTIFPGNAVAAAQKESLEQSFVRVIKNRATDVLPIYEYQIFLPDTGELISEYWSNTNEPVLDKNGNVTYIIRTVTNVSEKVQADRELEEADRQLESLYREQKLNEELAVTVEELRVMNEELNLSQEMLHSATRQLEGRVAERTNELEEHKQHLLTLNAELTLTNNNLVASHEQLVDVRHTQHRTEQMMQLAIEAADMGVWHIDIETRELTASARIKDLFGFYPADEMTLEKAIAQITEDHRDIVTQAIEKAITEGGNYDISYKVCGYHDKQMRWLRAIGNLVADEQGAYKAFAGVITDITKQVTDSLALEQANEELRAANEQQMVINEELSESQHDLTVLYAELEESNTRFLSLIAQAPVAIALFKTPDLVIDFVNDDMLAIWGKAPDIRGEMLSVAMPELAGQPFVNILQNTYLSGETYHGYDSRAQIVRNGDLIDGYFDFICQPIKNGNGQVTGVLQVVTEITEQVNARQQVERTQQEYYQALDSAALGTWSIAITDNQFKLSERSREIFGLPKEGEVTSGEAMKAVDEEFLPVIHKAIENGLNNIAPCDIQYSIRNLANGEKKWLRVTGKMFYDHVGKPDCFSGVIMDITEQKKDEQRKNDFIGMVSHEMKTPLTSLSGYLQLLQMRADQNDFFTLSMVSKAIKQVNKITTLINGFLNVSRLESGKIHIEKQRFDMAVLVRETEEEARTTINSHQVVFHPVECTEVNADRDKIGQVISNFISNAVKYSPAGTVINVSSRLVDGYVMVSVTDAGIGIKEEDQPKLFERYYRVNNDNATSVSGFGIGLYLCAEIIKRHDGKIWVESEVGNGSVFFFSLPVVEG